MALNDHIIRALAHERAGDLRGRRKDGAAWHQTAGVVESAAAGDESSWNTLIEAFGSTIRAVARSHRLSDADAADVAQATWLKLIEHVERLHDPSRVGAWLATTARRECLRVLRDATRRVPLDDSEPEHESDDSVPGDALLLFERAEALRRGFEQLRPSDQLLLGLLMAEPRRAYDEISAALRMPIGSIGPTRARALKRLRRELDKQGTLTLLSA